MRRLCLLLAAALLLPVSALAAAERADDENTPSPEEKFDNMDKNVDGELSREEFFAAYPHMHEAAFKNIDKNGDKVILQDEWLNFSGSHSMRGMMTNPRGMGGGPVMREMFRENGPSGGAAPPEASSGSRKPLFELKAKDESRP